MATSEFAVTVTAAFLKVNGYTLEFDDLDVYSFLCDLYESAGNRGCQCRGDRAFG